MIGSVLVMGLGEVGRPLLELVGDRYDAIGIDVEEVDFTGKCEVMHICYPFEIDDFVGQTARYIDRYRPQLTIVNTTVAPGTTRDIYQATHVDIAHSPVRGKHAKMKEELLHYVKFVGGMDDSISQKAADHFRSLGIKTWALSSPEATELAKLTETTYFALLVAWAQEVERYCDDLGLEYEEIVSFYEEIDYLPPVRYFSGVIGGHCLMPNIRILKQSHNSTILNAIDSSNEEKKARERRQAT